MAAGTSGGTGARKDQKGTGAGSRANANAMISILSKMGRIWRA